eukprot:scaffold236_cov117-Skeletonema_dohrnii-CCMP3373.AAC.2
MSTPQNCVLTGKWDEKIQACIDGDCSSTEAGCIEGLQTWINATSVDIDALNGETVGGGGIICNKAGGNGTVDVIKEDGVRCKVMDPPQSTLDGMKTMEIKDGVSGKVFDSNCVDGETQSLITAVCLSEEDCSEYGVPFKEQPDKDVNDTDTKDTGDVVVDDKKDDSLKENLNPSSAKAIVNNSPKYSDDEEVDEEDDGFFDPSSANARVNGIGGMLTMAAVVWRLCGICEGYVLAVKLREHKDEMRNILVALMLMISYEKNEKTLQPTDSSAKI